MPRPQRALSYCPTALIRPTARCHLPRPVASTARPNGRLSFWLHQREVPDPPHTCVAFLRSASPTVDLSSFRHLALTYRLVDTTICCLAASLPHFPSTARSAMPGSSGTLDGQGLAGDGGCVRRGQSGKYVCRCHDTTGLRLTASVPPHLRPLTAYILKFWSLQRERFLSRELLQYTTGSRKKGIINFFLAHLSRIQKNFLQSRT